MNTHPRPPADIIHDPAPIPSPILLHIARRARVSLAHAAVVAQLAGLGPQGGCAHVG